MTKDRVEGKMMMTVQETMPMIKLSESLFIIMTQLQNLRIISWKDIDLNWSLITILEENETIRQGLFPVPRASIPVSQGGKPKTDYQWMLAQKLFENHVKYKDIFASVQTVDKGNWQCKIKNHLNWWRWGQFSHRLIMLTVEWRMTKDICKYCNMMGEMSAGIIWEEDIDMEHSNSLTQSWGTFLHLIWNPIKCASFNKNLQLQSKRNVPGSSSWRQSSMSIPMLFPLVLETTTQVMMNQLWCQAGTL